MPMSRSEHSVRQVGNAILTAQNHDGGLGDAESQRLPATAERLRFQDASTFYSRKYVSLGSSTNNLEV